MYQFIDRLHALYGLLQDEQSKEIFKARFAFDMEQSVPNAMRLGALGRCDMGCPQPQKDVLKELNRENKKIILYGTAFTGQLVAGMLQFDHIDFYGFCSRRAERFPDGMMGKPVLSPDELIAHGNEYYVVPTVFTRKTCLEIIDFLREHSYPEDHILDRLIAFNSDAMNQYFEFPGLYRRGTAFVDGGCYDCESSYKFAEWCGGDYSSIIAFEPDPDNYAMCCRRLQDVPLSNLQLVNAGLSSQEGTVEFDALNSMLSHFIPTGLPADYLVPRKTEHGLLIRTVTLDDIVGDRTVGFIKMDIEGAEFEALQGAKNTIIRDKPFLAICVYHLQGDLFAIMDYLHQLLPEYRFWLRHYSSRDADTVLYASVDL